MALRATRSKRDPGGRSAARARGVGHLALIGGLAAVASACLPRVAPTAVGTPRAPLAGAEARAGLPRVVARPTEALERYAELCARCHGPGGAGDGYLAGTLDPPPTDLRAPARRLAPIRAHRAIERGVTGSSMKRFDHVLDETARWDMAFLVWSMPDDPAALARGAELYGARCAACHGAPGAPGAHRLDDPSRAERSPAEVEAILLEHRAAPIPEGARDRAALVAYLYAFLYEPIGVDAEDWPPAASSAPPMSTPPPGTVGQPR